MHLHYNQDKNANHKDMQL